MTDVSCRFLRSHKVNFPKEWGNAQFCFLIYTAMAFAKNNKKKFDKETQAFCDDCYLEFDHIIDQAQVMIDHAYICQAKKQANRKVTTNMFIKQILGGK